MFVWGGEEGMILSAGRSDAYELFLEACFEKRRVCSSSFTSKVSRMNVISSMNRRIQTSSSIELYL